MQFANGKRALSLLFALGAPLVSMQGCASETASSEHAGESRSALWNLPSGNDAYQDETDTDDPTGNIVVALMAAPGGPVVCTGTLLTPRLVLTAASCKNAAKAGATPVVGIGGRIPFRETIESSAFITLGTPAAEPSLSGQDLGIVVLKNYVLDDAAWRHPSFTSPLPQGAPSQSKLEVFANLGLAGWSSLDPGGSVLPFATNARQAYHEDTMSLWRYWTLGASTAKEPFWVYKSYTEDGIPKYGLSPGDNGAPLFMRNAAGDRDVVGVASILGDPADPAVRPQGLDAIQTCAAISPGTLTSCTGFVDVTNATIKAWIRAQSLDTTRTAVWLSRHPRLDKSELWTGDLDYFGPCRTDVDPDCDHVLEKNVDGSRRDNCPTVANPGQEDSDDDNRGDSCPDCDYDNECKICCMSPTPSRFACPTFTKPRTCIMPDIYVQRSPVCQSGTCGARYTWPSPISED